MFGLDQAVLDPKFGAGLIKGMIPGRFSFAIGDETVGELLAVIGQDDPDPERRSFMQAFQEALCGSERSDKPVIGVATLLSCLCGSERVATH